MASSAAFSRQRRLRRKNSFDKSNPKGGRPRKGSRVARTSGRCGWRWYPFPSLVLTLRRRRESGLPLAVQFRPVSQVAHFRGYSKGVSGCSTAPYEFFHVVRCVDNPDFTVVLTGILTAVSHIEKFAVRILSDTVGTNIQLDRVRECRRGIRGASHHLH